MLGRNPSSVYREIQRNSNDEGVYEPSLAQVKAESRLSTRKNHIKFTPEIKVKIEKGLLEEWSPQQIVGHYGSVK